jgi:uncharacterized membrane protein YhiD involved in acid resistance
MSYGNPKTPGNVIGMLGAAVFAIVIGLALILGLWAAFAAFGRYQTRANANNRVKVSAIEIRNQAQRVKVTEQQADIRYRQAVGIRRSQDEIARTLTPLYVAFEMTQALQHIATSGQNNSIIYLPTNPSTGLPIVPTSNLPTKATKK